MASSFFDVSDFVYGLERTGRAPEHVFLDESLPDQDAEMLEALVASPAQDKSGRVQSLY